MWFELEIWKPERAPIRDVFQGQTLEWALYQAYKKHPGAIVCVPDQPAKPDLAKSSNGSKKVAKRRRDAAA